YGYHGIIFTKKGFINKLMNKNFDFLELSNFSIMIQIDDNYSGFDFYSVTKNSIIPEENKVYFSNISKLEPNDIILPAYAYYNYIEYFMRKYYEKRYGSDDKYYEERPNWYDDLTLDFDRYLLEEFIPQNYPQDFYVQEPISATYNDGENVEYLSYKAYTPDEMAELDENEKHKIYFTYLKSQYYNEWDKYTYNYLRDVYKYYSLTKALKDETKLNEFLNFVNPKNAHAAIGLVRSDRIYLQNDYNIVGVYCPSDFYEYYFDLRGRGDGLPLIINDDFYNKLALKYNGYYYYLIAPMPSSESEISRLVKFGYDNSFENGVSYQMRNNVMSIMREVNNLIENLAKVFLYIGIGFAVFSALLLMNFITISISYKSKEIGILRAIGARSSDVFGIFFNESMIIALINYALSIIATVLGVFWINSLLRNEYKLLITLLVFGIRQIVLMLAISVGVAFIASFFPVMRVARKKPVEAMKK
ncbi:MAG TPA: FtsX-like permease family protein, partial [Clostridia bacterium]